MQSYAKNTNESMEKTVGLEKETLDVMDVTTKLFSTDEIIFPDENTERPYARYGYKIAAMNFLVPEKTVSEVIQCPNIYNLPNSPSWIEGLINIRGNIIPVMNIDKLLKNASSKRLNNILVLDKSDNKTALAIMISDLPISLEYNDSKTDTNNYPSELQEYIKCGFNQNNLDWVEFNPQELFKKLSGKVVS